VHLFTLATMVVCFAVDCKHNNRKDKCRFFLFPSNTKEYKQWEDYLTNLIPSKIIDLLRENTIAIVNIVNCTVSFENELVSLNGRIQPVIWVTRLVFPETCVGHCYNNNNNNPIYMAPYAELQRRWAAVNQAAVNINVFRCFLKAESELQSRMFDGRLFQIAGAE